MVDLAPSEAPRLLRLLRGAVRPAVRGAAAYALRNGFHPLEGRDGTPLDLLFALSPFHRSAITRGTVATLGGLRARVCGVEDLVLMKVLAGRPQDLDDVRALVRAHRRTLDLARIHRLVRTLADDFADREAAEIWFGALRPRRGRSR